MADIYNGEVGAEWVNVSSLTTLTSDSEYLIQNQGNSLLQACVTSSTPDVNTDLGTKLPPMSQAHYKVGEGNLYLRGVQGACRINISEAE